MREATIWFAAAVLFLAGALIWFAQGSTGLGIGFAGCAVMMAAVGLRARSAGQRTGTEPADRRPHRG